MSLIGKRENGAIDHLHLPWVLATVGIYGVVSYGVARRSREIGIILSLGATRGRIVRGVVFGLAGPVLVGIGVGVVTTVVVGRTVSVFLYETSPADPLLLGLVTWVLVVAAVLASLIPAGRVAGLDPVRVLSVE